jgi:hypothetical protein
MILSQLLTKDKESIQYTVENLTPQTLYYAIYRKKMVLMGQGQHQRCQQHRLEVAAAACKPLTFMCVVTVLCLCESGSATVERLTEPTLLQPGEASKVQKPDLKMGWKRYIAFAQDEALLTASPKPKEFEALLCIWVDELNTVVLTEELCEDGVRAVRASSWMAWSARRKAAPATHKLQQTKEAFLADINGKLVAGLEPHLHSNTVARVRHGPELCSEEHQFNEMREPIVHKALGRLLPGVDMSLLPVDLTPRISVCASGGGYRAMVATIGSLIGMEQTGLLDTVMSISGLSGSTWAMASWYSGRKTLQETRLDLADKLGQRFFTPTLWPETVQSHVRERVGFNQEMGLVDVMGWHLHNHLLKDLPCCKERWGKPRLSEQAFAIVDGSKPMPIYTAVAHEHKRFRSVVFLPDLRSRARPLVSSKLTRSSVFVLLLLDHLSLPVGWSSLPTSAASLKM